jgi:hypothetical protein
MRSGFYESGAAHLSFRQPIVHGHARESGQSPGQFNVGQTTGEQIINCTDGYAEAGSKLPFIFVIPRWWLGRARHVQL